MDASAFKWDHEGSKQAAVRLLLCKVKSHTFFTQAPVLAVLFRYGTRKV